MPFLFRKKISPATLEKSSTSNMLKGLVFNGRTIKDVYKTSERGRLIRFVDGTSQTADKDELIALARIKGSMIGEQKSKLMTPWQRQQRMQRGMRIKEGQILKSKEGRQRFIKIRNLSGKLAKQVEGVPEVKFEHVMGVKVPVVAHYYSTEKPDIKGLIQKIKQEYGTVAQRRLKQLLREKGNASRAYEQLMEEMKKRGRT